MHMCCIGTEGCKLLRWLHGSRVGRWKVVLSKEAYPILALMAVCIQNGASNLWLNVLILFFLCFVPLHSPESVLATKTSRSKILGCGSQLHGHGDIRTASFSYKSAALSTFIQNEIK